MRRADLLAPDLAACPLRDGQEGNTHLIKDRERGLRLILGTQDGERGET